MSAHVSLNLLNKLRKAIKCKACQAFYPFFSESYKIQYNRSTKLMLDSV